MKAFSVAKLDDSIVKQIKEFEVELKGQTGYDMAIVAYAQEHSGAQSQKTNQ